MPERLLRQLQLKLPKLRPRERVRPALPKILAGKDKKIESQPLDISSNLPDDLREEYRERLHRFMFGSGVAEKMSDGEQCQPQPLSCSDGDRQLLHTMHWVSSRRFFTNQMRGVFRAKEI